MTNAIKRPPYEAHAVITGAFVAAGVNDWLQAGFSALTRKANELET